MEEKRCPECGHTKLVKYFPRNKRKRDGYDLYCKDCTNRKSRERYALDPGKKIAMTRKYHLEHPEWSRRVLADWHQRNAERRLERHYELGQDPEVAEKRRAATRRCESRRRAIIAGVEAELLSEEDYLSILEEYGGRCWICDVDLTTVALHWDHYKPLAKGGEHSMANLRPACADCNVRKNSNWPVTDDMLNRIRSAVIARRAGVPGV